MDNNKTRYYETLSIKTSANREEIAAAFREKALRTHPMKCAREDEAQSYKEFVRVCEAYEVLADPVMKRIYDKYGEYSLKHGIMKGTDRFIGYTNEGKHFKIFSQFFGCENPFIEEPVARPGDETELQMIDADNRPSDIHVTL